MATNPFKHTRGIYRRARIQSRVNQMDFNREGSLREPSRVAIASVAGLATGAVLSHQAIKLAQAHRWATGGIGAGLAVGGGAEIVHHRHNSSGRHQ